MIKIIEEKNITPQLDSEIKNALCLCFPEDRNFFSLSRAWHNSYPEISFIMLENNRIVAHVAIVNRRIMVRNQFVKVAGIQNVFVLPEYRGKGLCKEIMTFAMQNIKKYNFDLGLLFCVPDLERTYSQCSWSIMSKREITRTTESGETIPLPNKNISMYYPLEMKQMPEGNIDLMGNDW